MNDSKALADYEAYGVGIAAIVAAFRNYPSVAMKYLEKFGIVKPGQEIVQDKWYPFGPWIGAIHAMGSEVGSNSLYRIGRSVPEAASFPPHVNDIHSCLQSVDVGYRMNHRLNGVLLAELDRDKTAAAGQYRYKAIEGENEIRCTCDNPYPCDLDRGLIAAMAARFQPLAKTQHDPDGPCRRRGDSSCTYVVFW